jgi:hypothetical protein
MWGDASTWDHLQPTGRDQGRGYVSAAAMNHGAERGEMLGRGNLNHAPFGSKGHQAFGSQTAEDDDSP